VVLEEDKKNLLNTVSEDIEQASESPEIGISYLIVGVSLAVLVGAILTFASVKSKQSTIDSLKVSIENDVTAPLAALSQEQKQVTTIKNQLSSLKTALNSREQFGKILAAISVNLLKSSMLTSVSVQEEDITMSGSADNYSDVAKLVAAYRQVAVVKEVQLSSATLNEESDKVDFSLSLKIDRSKFKMGSGGTTATSKLTGVKVGS
jgi:Tfp pilus assembly protein PilN